MVTYILLGILALILVPLLGLMLTIDKDMDGY